MVKKGFLIVIIISLLLVGCSRTSGREDGKDIAAARYVLDENVPAWQMDTKEEETILTWYVNADWWNTEFGEDVVTKKIKEDLNIHIKFITGDDTKLNTYFAGGDMPDVVTIFNANSSAAKTADRWAYALDDLAVQYDPYFFKVASEDTLNWYKLGDGKSYGYPDYSNSQKDYDEGYIQASTAFAIRNDVYEALGQPNMGTPEEFLLVLGDIKSAYPELIPFGFNSMLSDNGSLGADLQNYLGIPIETEDGEYYDRNLDEDYLRWITVFNQAHRLGYISDDSFSDDGTAHEDKIKAGKYASVLIGGTPQRSGALQVFMASNPDAAYIAIDGPKSTMGREIRLTQSGLSGWMINYITKQCSDPAKAIQVFTYLLQEEGGILTTYGVEGETYEITQDGKYALLPHINDVKLNDVDTFKKKYRLGEFILFGHDRYLTFGTEQTKSTQQMRDWGDGKLKTQYIIENIVPDQGTAEARSLSAIVTKWNTTLVSLIRAKDELTFQQVLEDYKRFLEENSWGQIVSVYNQKMEENRLKLGLK